MIGWPISALNSMLAGGDSKTSCLRIGYDNPPVDWQPAVESATNKMAPLVLPLINHPCGACSLILLFTDAFFKRANEALSVVRLTPKCCATSVLVIFGSNNIAAAFCMSVFDSAGFRPPLRPLARAASNPAIVRSRSEERRVGKECRAGWWAD